ncbi:MAG: hypothetical protein M1824_004931 [Vezdaea acicularis]|nr:MAG: hypothetical protein M1824_004931 [Vezdaea acicularis]
MSKKETVPNAWDDDWEAQADRQLRSDEGGKDTVVPPSLSKAERLAQHAEANRKLWESAEQTDSFHFLAAREEVPLKSDFKPAVKVLSRKPTPKVISRSDPLTGESQLTVEDFRDEDDEGLQTNTLSPEEMRLKSQREREEKQRRYEEVRERLFGSASTSPSPGSTSGSTTADRIPQLNKSTVIRDVRVRGRGRGVRANPISFDQEEHQHGYETGGTNSDIRRNREIHDLWHESKPISTSTPEQSSNVSMKLEIERVVETTAREPRQPKPNLRGFGNLFKSK